MGVCSFIYACICVSVCMHASLSNCVYVCVSMHVSFKSMGVRVSNMCLHVLNLSGPRLPEAGFRPERSYGMAMSSVRPSVRHVLNVYHAKWNTTYNNTCNAQQ